MKPIECPRKFGGCSLPVCRTYGCEIVRQDPKKEFQKGHELTQLEFCKLVGADQLEEPAASIWYTLFKKGFKIIKQ